MENQADGMLIGRPGDAQKSHWKMETVKLSGELQMSACAEWVIHPGAISTSRHGDTRQSLPSEALCRVPLRSCLLYQKR
ncbi:hypothetical protein AMECASPLE_018273 [Ameca splendens]|uniref:Uncharacterized protein n=1 Tax=Ameca splendens TaxID=208324 RepID=A0ABV0ZBS8_9TELE